MVNASDAWAVRLKVLVVVAAACVFVPLARLPSTDSMLLEAAARLRTLELVSRNVSRARGDLLRLHGDLAAGNVGVEVDLDFIPFTAAELLRHEMEQLPPLVRAIPEVAPAPLGRRAIDLARANAYPDSWNARQRPTLFLLGPPKTGTTFLAGCWRFAMVGDAARRSYPVARERWPLEFSKSGEPEWGDSLWGGHRIPTTHMWNRTGYRRWDPPKEWYIYSNLGSSWDTPKGFVQRRRFPPVEEGSKGWVLMDATPTYIMRPAAADGIRRDFRDVPAGSPLSPTFLVMLRDPVDRAYSHFLLFSSQRKSRGLKEDDAAHRVFARHLEEELSRLRSVPVCRMMVEEPEALVADMLLVRRALSTCVDTEEGYWTKPNFFAQSFVALGLRYWLHQFPPHQFRLMRTADLKLLDAGGVQHVLGDLFDMAPMKPRCKVPGQVDNPACTPQLQYDHADLFCSKDSPALAAQSWTGRSKRMRYRKGGEGELAPFRKIAERWEAILLVMLQEHKMRVYRPSAKETILEGNE